MSRLKFPKNRPAWRCLRAVAAAVVLLGSAMVHEAAAAAAAGEPEPPTAMPPEQAPAPTQSDSAAWETVPAAPVVPPAAPASPPVPAATPTVPAAAPVVAPAPPAVPAAVTQEGLRSLEQRVGDLKEQVFRAKARLSLLSERFLRSTAGGGRAVIVQKNQMGHLYVPLRITYKLDGREVFAKGDEGGGLSGAAGELPIWEGGLKPGDHTLAVSVVYRGNGNRVFGYFNQYNYTASAAQRFTANDGGITRIRVVCREKGNPALTDVAERPLIEFQVDDGSTKPPGGGNPAATATASAKDSNSGLEQSGRP